MPNEHKYKNFKQIISQQSKGTLKGLYIKLIGTQNMSAITRIHRKFNVHK